MTSGFNRWGALRIRHHNPGGHREREPQGLKPLRLWRLCGTTEVKIIYLTKGRTDEYARVEAAL